MAEPENDAEQNVRVDVRSCSRWPTDQVEQTEADVAGIHQSHARNRELNVIAPLMVRRLLGVGRKAEGKHIWREKMSANCIQRARVQNDCKAHLDEHHAHEGAENSDQEKSGSHRERNGGN